MTPGWKIEPLGELCEFQRGLTYAKGDEVDVSDNIVLRATNIDLATNLLDFAELKYINDKVIVPASKKVKKGSLMICTASGSKSHLGKIAYIDDDYGYAFGGFMGMITPKNGLIPKYLFHLMTSGAYKGFIGELSDGTNINNLKFDDLKKFQVPHPRPDEQQRIVGILDEAFEDIATAKANTEKNLHNARALFESFLNVAIQGKSRRILEILQLRN
jgi:type I restriction enzyme, S subunit